MLLTLPGASFIYQGDEIGLTDGPGHDPPFDRAGRDGARHPMQWTPDAATGGFTTGRPWLDPVDPLDRSVEASRSDPASLLSLYRSLIALRGSLGPGCELIDADDGVVAYTRGDRHVIALNFDASEREAPPHGPIVQATDPALRDAATLPPHTGWIAEAP
jgi:alpha-glucosidase